MVFPKKIKLKINNSIFCKGKLQYFEAHLD